VTKKSEKNTKPKRDGALSGFVTKIKNHPKILRFISFIEAMRSRKGIRFRFCRNFIIYLLVLAFALIFTQALRSPLSSVLYVFMLILPFASLLHVLLSPLFIKASAESRYGEVYKLVPTSFKVCVSNDGIIPYPFAEAVIHVPDENAVRCITRKVWLSMLPMSSYDVAQNVTFSYRGNYSIGVSSVYVYDFLRLFRLRLDCEAVTDVFVMPRRLILEEATKQAPSDINSDSSRNIIGVDRSELSDIRAYRIGDHMKTIHWQLSSKTQELVVKEFAMNSGKTVYIFADLAAHYDTEDITKYENDINEYSADGVIESCLAAASRELQEGNGVTLLWYDSRVEQGTQTVNLQTPADLSRVFKTFATAPIVKNTAECDVTRLASLTGDTQTASLLFVTPSLDEELANGLLRVASAFGNIRERSAIGVILCEVLPRVKENAHEEFTSHRDAVSMQLNAGGINVTSPKMI